MFARPPRRMFVSVMATLFVALASFGPAALTAPAVAAAPLKSSVVYDIADSNLVAEELSPIDLKVKGSFNNFRKLEKPWRCIAELHEYVEDANENPEPEPLAPPARVDVRVTRWNGEVPLAETPAYAGDYTVEVTLTVRGKAPRSKTATVESDELFTIGRGGTERVDIARIAEAASNLLNELMREGGPCAAKGAFKLNGGTSLNGNPTRYAYEGTIDLSLDEAGAFDAEAPLTASIAMDPVTGCTRTFTVVNPRLRGRGGYREADGALAIEELTIEHDAIVSTDDCTFRSGPCVFEERDRLERVSGPCPAVSEGVIAFSLFGGRRARLGGETDLATPLGAMASLALARPGTTHPNLTAWSATLEVAPDAPGVPVAATASDAPARSQ